MNGPLRQDEPPARVIVADWLIAMDAPTPRAIRRGAVRVAADGTITAVGPLDELLMPGDALTVHPDAVLTPGLINAHAHLDMSYWSAGQRARLAGLHLHDWVAPVVAARRERPADQVAAAAADGARASLSAGVTAVVDVTPASIAWSEVLDAVSAVPVRRVALAEVIGFGSRGRSSWSDAERAIQMPNARCPMPGVRHPAFGISPHAPYSTSAEAYALCLSSARRRGLPLMTHLAETAEEIQFCRTGGGPWRRRLGQLAGPQPDLEPPGCSPIAYARRLGLLEHRPTLLAHVNCLGPGDMELLSAARGVTVVYCPRTADFFGHREHPWRDLPAAGVNVAVGTDSLASSPDLSILGELRFLRERHGDVSAGELFALATRNGAAAIGASGRLGELTAGAAADLVAWPIRPDVVAADTAETILAWLIQTAPPPRKVYVAGRPTG